MLRELFSRWFSTPEPEITEPVEPEVPLEAVFMGESRSNGGPHLSGLARDWGNTQKACDVRDCQRPSAYDVTTLQHLDIDVPFKQRIENVLPRFEVDQHFVETQRPVLPTYQFYHLCDRHYHTFIRGKAPNGQVTKLVIGPQVIYSVDEDGKRTSKSS